MLCSARVTEVAPSIVTYQQPNGASDEIEYGVTFRTSKPKLAPPLYGVKVTGALFHTQGGLVVDDHARVVPLPNVFAGAQRAACRARTCGVIFRATGS